MSPATGTTFVFFLTQPNTCFFASPTKRTKSNVMCMKHPWIMPHRKQCNRTYWMHLMIKSRSTIPFLILAWIQAQIPEYLLSWNFNGDSGSKIDKVGCWNFLDKFPCHSGDQRSKIIKKVLFWKMCFLCMEILMLIKSKCRQWDKSFWGIHGKVLPVMSVHLESLTRDERHRASRISWGRRLQNWISLSYYHFYWCWYDSTFYTSDIRGRSVGMRSRSVYIYGLL